MKKLARRHQSTARLFCDARAGDAALPAASRATSAQEGPPGAGISAVSLSVCVSQTGSARRRSAQPAPAGSEPPRGAQESCGNPLARPRPRGHGRRLAKPGTRGAAQRQRSFSCRSASSTMKCRQRRLARGERANPRGGRVRCPRAERAGSHPIASAADELPTALPRPAPLSQHGMPWTVQCRRQSGRIRSRHG